MDVFIGLLTVFVLAMFVGFEVITKIPPILHTPLMSGSNAISGITIIGAILSAGTKLTMLTTVLSLLAVMLAMANVVGGFFAHPQDASHVPDEGARMNPAVIQLAYLFSCVLFIVGFMQLSRPKTAKRGNLWGHPGCSWPSWSRCSISRS